MIAEYEGPGQVMKPGATVVGHPALSDGVVVENNAFGRFVFYIPGQDDVLNVVFWTDGAEAAEEDDETALMAMSDSVLSDLGWVPA